MTEQPTSDQSRYSAVAILLHWLLAAALAFQLALGFAMPKDATGFAAYQLHKSVGIAILLLTLVRLAWRLVKRPPPPVERGLAGIAAKAVHAGFYGVLIFGPLTGWVLVSTAPVEVPTVLFGVLPWPHLPLPSDIHPASEEAHELLSWFAIGLFGLHVAGALRHHFILQHRLLERIAPAGSTAAAGLLSALVVAAGVVTFAVVWTEAPTEADRMNPPLGERTLEASHQENAIATSEQEEVEPFEEPVEPAEPPPADGPPTWTIQPGGRLSFSVGNGSDTLHGSFAEWGGSIRFDPEHPEDADIRIDVELTSASVGDTTMDSLLKGAEFLAAEANRTASWRATSIRRAGPARYTAQGLLTLKGASRPQELSFTLSGNGPRRQVGGSATIDRTAFAIGSGPSAESLSQAVSLEFSFEAASDAL
jgi:cytochrome b561/polyisoprenoid-binding protein YceI